jgi:hypothetical protein
MADSLPVLATEIGMVRRRIGQEDLIARSEPRGIVADGTRRAA